MLRKYQIVAIGKILAATGVHTLNLTSVMQHKPLLYVTAAIAVFLTGCEGTSLGSFSADEEIPATRVEGGGLTSILPTAFTPFNLDVKSSAAFNSNDYDVLNEIKITGITLSILPESENTETDSSENGIADDFAFINSLSLYIQADINGTSQRELVAELPAGFAETNDGVRDIVMVMQGVNILDYVEAPSGYKIESEANGTAPADDVVFGGTVDYTVKIGFR